VRILKWFLFFLIAGVLIFGYYFYRFEWIPTQKALEDLEQENKRLFSLLKEYSEIEEDTVPSPSLPKEVKSLVEEKPDEGLKITLSVSDLFSRGKTKLKDSGKKLIKNFYQGIKKRKISYREIEILIHPDPPKGKKLAARRALAVKYYFIKLGVNRNKVWAWVKEHVPPGKIVISVKK
jgi:outer membrane protein OmpA-like peptidoglycan-associated protein